MLPNSHMYISYKLIVEQNLFDTITSGVLAIWSRGERIRPSQTFKNRVTPYTRISNLTGRVPVTLSTRSVDSNGGSDLRDVRITDSHGHNLTVYYHNASSIRCKTKEFLLGVLNTDYDCIVITETWLTKRFFTEEYFPNDYIVYRRDRYNFDTDLKGGGVLIALKQNLESWLIVSHHQYEILAVRVKGSGHCLIIIPVYIPCDADQEMYTGITSYICSLISSYVKDGDKLLIMGDFNLPNISWLDVEGVVVASSLDPVASLLIDSLAALAVSQFNWIPNKCGKFLDLVFALEDESHPVITPCEDFSNYDSQYHSPISIEILFVKNCNTRFTNFNISYFNFRRADYTSLNQFLSEYDWDYIKRNGNLNDMVGRLYEALWEGIRLFVPVRRRKPHFREPWFNDNLARLERRRNLLHTKFKRYGAQYYQAFKSTRREFKILNAFLYNNYILQIETELTSNPKRFWSFINGKRQNSNGLPPQMVYRDCVADQPMEICNLFARFFESVYSPSQQSVRCSQQHDFSLINLSEEEVIQGLASLDVDKGSGHDGIPPAFLKGCAASLGLPLSNIFNISLTTGVFPDLWKISHIQPIFKAGRKNDIENYRGIAILSAIPKLFEAMIHTHLMFHLKSFITPSQHGFYPGRSTVSNLVSFCSVVFSNAGSNLQTDVVYTDFSKAFDKIDISIFVGQRSEVCAN